MTQNNTNEVYEQFLAVLERIGHLDSINGLLGWDEQVNLPSNSVEKRAREIAVLAELTHKESTCDSIGELISTLQKRSDELDVKQRCVVTDAEKKYKRLTCLPSAFVAKRAEAHSVSYHAWTKAREGDDFVSFLPHIEKLIDLSLEEASFVGCQDAPYDYFIDKHDPDVTTAVIDPLFDALKRELVPLVDSIVSSPVKAKEGLFKNFPEKDQEAFLREVTAALGFDYSKGRLDVAVHPFCGGSSEDVRMTTRYHKDNPLDSLFSSIHETGHALYEQGLPKKPYGTALTRAVGMAVHESQSRLWENQVSRSRAFWNYWEPKYRECFADQLKSIDSADLYLAINSVKRSLIRVDSDEVTYNLHIILRYTLEKQLFNGTLKAADLPEAWSAHSEELLGLRPERHSEGVLQDVHWSCGAFGYFPSYCLGNMMAAQLWYAAMEALQDPESDFEAGKFERLLDWLRSNIHAHGSLYGTNELVKRASGRELSSDSLLKYLRERYLPLYQL